MPEHDERDQIPTAEEVQNARDTPAQELATRLGSQRIAVIVIEEVHIGAQPERPSKIKVAGDIVYLATGIVGLVTLLGTLFT